MDEITCALEGGGENISLAFSPSLPLCLSASLCLSSCLTHFLLHYFLPFSMCLSRASVWVTPVHSRVPFTGAFDYFTPQDIRQVSQITRCALRLSFNMLCLLYTSIRCNCDGTWNYHLSPSHASSSSSSIVRYTWTNDTLHYWLVSTGEHWWLLICYSHFQAFTCTTLSLSHSHRQMICNVSIVSALMMDASSSDNGHTCNTWKSETTGNRCLWERKKWHFPQWSDSLHERRMHCEKKWRVRSICLCVCAEHSLVFTLYTERVEEREREWERQLCKHVTNSHFSLVQWFPLYCPFCSRGRWRSMRVRSLSPHHGPVVFVEASTVRMRLREKKEDLT